MFCKDCGHEIKDDASFCSKCGQRTEAKIKKDNIEQHNKEVDDRFKKEIRIFIPVLIIVVLIVIFIGAGSH